MLDFCSTGKPHYKVPHYNVVFNIHVTCQYNKLSLIVCDYGPQRQKYTVVDLYFLWGFTENWESKSKAMQSSRKVPVCWSKPAQFHSD